MPGKPLQPIRRESYLTCTKALLAKVSGKSQMNPADCAASTLWTSRPIVAEIHEKAKLTSRIMPKAASQPNGLPCGWKPTSSPTTSITITTTKLRSQIGQGAPRQHGGLRHRQRAEAVDQAALQVLRQPDAGRRRAEDDRLDEDARHEVVDVADARRQLGDRPAEDIAKEQTRTSPAESWRRRSRRGCAGSGGCAASPARGRRRRPNRGCRGGCRPRRRS